MAYPIPNAARKRFTRFAQTFGNNTKINPSTPTTNKNLLGLP